MTEKAAKSFQEIFEAAFSLLGIIPFLIAVYVFISMDVEISQGMMFAAAGVFFFLLIGLSMLRKSSNQIQMLSEMVNKAMTANVTTAIDPGEGAPREISELARSFNAMLADMDRTNMNYREISTKMMLYARDIEDYQQQLRDEAVIRHRLGSYVGSNIVDHLVESGVRDLPLQNDVRDVTVLFADIRSFTTLSESMQPEEIIIMLNEYFDAMVNIIFDYHGILDKFVGDELMAVFGVIGQEDCAAENAVKAALAMQYKITEIMDTRIQQGKQPFKVGIGINTGNVVIGNVGSKNRMDYTVIGDTVNVAARFEQMTEGDTVMIGHETFCRCTDFVREEKMGEITVRNRSQPVKYHIVSDQYKGLAEK